VTTGSTVGADEPSDDAIARLARRHGLDPLAPSAATIQYLDQAIEQVAHRYLTAEAAELTEEVRLYLAWVRRLLDNSRAPAQHHRLYVQLGYLTGILAQLALARATTMQPRLTVPRRCEPPTRSATASCGPGS
jgi:transposase-like protein